jgi:hypothetical protein
LQVFMELPEQPGGRTLRLPLLDSEQETLVDVRVRPGGAAAAEGAKLDLYVLLRGARVRVSPRMVRDLLGVGKHLKAEVEAGEGEGAGPEEPSSVQEEDEELDFKRIEAYLMEVRGCAV